MFLDAVNVKSSVKPISVYLAGKVAGDKWKLVQDIPAEVARFSSSDSSNHSEHNSGIGKMTLPAIEGISPVDVDHREFVADFFIPEVHLSDLMLAYIDCTSCFGTIAEIAYFAAHGKPCFVLLLNDHPQENQLDMFDAYWFVCSLPCVNPFVVSGFKQAKSKAWSILYKEHHRRVLDSDGWKRLKLQAIHRAGNRCQLCNAQGRLHVHHRTYDNLGNEDLDDVIVLCDSCHERFHDKV